MSEPAERIVYGTELSGHTHRVVLLLNLLNLPYRFVATPAEERNSAAFLRLNPLGQIPVLSDGGIVLADSCAILVYLAKRYAPGSSWLPEDPVGAANVQRWLSIGAGEVRYGPAAARLMTVWKMPGDHGKAVEISGRLLGFMESHLVVQVGADRGYLAAEHPTIADIACYSYVAHAPEGGVSLEPFPAVRAWISRVEALPGFKPMPASARTV